MHSILRHIICCALDASEHGRAYFVELQGRFANFPSSDSARYSSSHGRSIHTSCMTATAPLQPAQTELLDLPQQLVTGICMPPR